MLVETLRREMRKERKEARRQGLEEGRAKGMKIGIEEGRKKGRMEGKKEGRIIELKTITKEMLKEKLDIETIKRCTKLSEEEIKKISDEK